MGHLCCLIYVHDIMYSTDLRVAAVKMYFKLRSLRKTSELIDIPKSTLHRWVKNMSFVKRRRQATKVTSAAIEFVKDYLSKREFATVQEVVGKIKELLNHELSASSVRTCVKRSGNTYKRCGRVVHKQGLDEYREKYAQMMQSDGITPYNTISIDETSIYFDLKPSYGWSPKGKTLKSTLHPYHRHRWSLVMAVNNECIVDAMIVKGSIDALAFTAFVRKLKPQGRKFLMMDNARFHHSDIVKNACKSVCIQPLYLPPYTPFFQPIEHCFSVLKSWYCRAPLGIRGSEVPTNEIVNRRISESMDQITTDKLQNTFAKCWQRMSDWAEGGRTKI